MNRMYFLFLAIVGLAVIINIFFCTNNKYNHDIAIGPVYQVIVTIPIFIVSATIFFFMQNTDLGISYRNLFLFLPFILEILIIVFALNIEILSIFKADSNGFMFRTYVYSIGLATIVVGLFNWTLVKIF